MVEFHRLEFDRSRSEWRNEIFEQDRIAKALGVRCVAKIRDHHHPLQRRQAIHDGARIGQRLHLLAREKVSVGAQHHLGFNLAEAVDHALYAEIRRTGGPDGPDARCSQHCSD